MAVASDLRTLQTDNLELIFVGQKNDKNAGVITAGDSQITSYLVHAGKFRRFHSLSLIRQLFNVWPNLLNIRDGFLIVLGFFESFFLLLRLRPDVIFFKGGFVVVPIGYAARLLRIPYITHDSDALPGLANRLIAKGARYNAVAHAGVTYYPKAKTVVTGIPLSHEYAERQNQGQARYKELLDIPAGSTMLFIYTGTQGARIVDDALTSVVPRLLERYSHLYIVQVFGRLNEQRMDKRYGGLSKDMARRVRKLSFIDNAYDYIAAADIIIGRAGATSMAEFATVGRACIIVPAEQLTGGHQLMNAQLLAKEHAIVIARELHLADSLRSSVEHLIADKQARHRLAKTIQTFATTDASKRIAELIVSIKPAVK